MVGLLLPLSVETEKAMLRFTENGQKRIMWVQHGGTALLGLFNVLLNAFILSFIT